MKLLSILLFCCFALNLQAQVFLQLELFNDPKALKYGVGDKIVFKVDYLEDVWQKGTIEQILPKDNVVLLNNNLVNLDQVTDFMLYRHSVNYIGRLLQTFGIVYAGYGIVGLAATDNVTVRQVVTVGGGSIAAGWLLRKLFYKIPIALGEKNRLRIVDLRFFIPEDDSLGN